ncbi:MAG: diacylglycerol kinase family lipid kinase [Lachnospiraceae bacterium]|nr:diacylglycerol kinase family lipid kinase [Lachnospiraceae bacterium]
MKKIMLVYNPIAGRGQFSQSLPAVIEILTKAGFRVEVWPTSSRGDATEKTALYGGEADIIVAAGGDGTLDEVIEGMYRGGIRRVMGYIPVGSTNDFAQSLKLSTNPIEAAHAIAGAEIAGVDVGCFNKDHFIYVAAFGAFTDVSYKTAQDMKNALGHLAYLLEASKELLSIKPLPMTIEADGRTVSGEFLYGMVTNSLSVGGIKNITGHAVALNDGLFEVTLIRNPKNLFELNEIIAALLTGKDDSPLLEFFKTDHIVFTAPEDTPWTLDGEYGGAMRRAEICVSRQALPLLIDPQQLERAKDDAIL